MKDKTLIIGASNNPSRYSYKAAYALTQNGFDFIPFGVKKGELNGKNINNDWNDNWDNDVDTVTMYVNPKLQEQYYNRIIQLKPRRVIFNPGTENNDFVEQLSANGIQHEYACTLVLLGTNQY